MAGPPSSVVSAGWVLFEAGRTNADVRNARTSSLQSHQSAVFGARHSVSILPAAEPNSTSNSLAIVGATSTFSMTPSLPPDLIPAPDATKTAFIFGFVDE